MRTCLRCNIPTDGVPFWQYIKINTLEPRQHYRTDTTVCERCGWKLPKANP